MSDDGPLVIEVFGEGKTDVGLDPRNRQPTLGVLPILVHRLCGKPKNMRVRSSTRLHLERIDVKAGGGYRKKAERFRTLARQNNSAGAVFVIDSDGDLEKKQRDVTQGRDAGPADLPMAVGVAHPCVEAWLLADAGAIRRGIGLSSSPALPEDPEVLSPKKDNKQHPKPVLARAAGSRDRDLGAKEKDAIATAMNDMDLVRRRCPLSFAPFADEVDRHIRPLF